MKIMNELLGNQIKTLRIKRGLLQEEVSEQIGVSSQKYDLIENGKVNITLDILSKIAEVTKVTVTDITNVLSESSDHQESTENVSTKKIFDILDLFYANKHLYERVKLSETEQECITMGDVES